MIVFLQEEAERFGALPEVTQQGQGNAQISLQRPNQAGEQFFPYGRELVFIE